MSDTLQKLTPETLEALMAQLKNDPARKLEIIQRINEVGLAAVAREHFLLTDQQEKFLDRAAAGKNGTKLWDLMVSQSLVMGGKIGLVVGATISTDVGVHVGPDGVDVSVHC